MLEDYTIDDATVATGGMGLAGLALDSAHSSALLNGAFDIQQELPFLRKGTLISIAPDDLVSLSTRVLEARVMSLTMWESKPVSAPASGPNELSVSRRSMRISVGDTVQFCMKQQGKETNVQDIQWYEGYVTRITFATKGPDCKNIGQKMVRVTNFLQSSNGTPTESTQSISPGRIRKVLAPAASLTEPTISRLKSFFEKNDNCYCNCFLEWASWPSEERAEYCARCTAGEMVAAAGITTPTEEQVRTILDRARTIVSAARSNVSAINASRGGLTEPVPRRRRHTKTNSPLMGTTDIPGATGSGFGEHYSLLGLATTQSPGNPPLKRKKRSSDDMDEMTKNEISLVQELEAYRELVQKMKEELHQREQELRAEADRRVEEVRATLMTEIERLSTQLSSYQYHM